MSAIEPGAGRKSAGARLVDWMARLDDGVILKTAFYAMLAGTAWVLYSDYSDLSDVTPADLAVAPGDPMLPAVDRPEIDPDNPAYRPQERITTPPETLAAPLSIELIPGGVLMLTGTITPGAAQTFADEVERRGDYVTTVALDSPGGSVDDALAIGSAIREAGFATAVADGALCASSCPLVLAGGVERIVSESAAVGVHQIYAGVGGGDIGSAQAMSDAQAITARISRYLMEMGVEPALWLNAMETPPDRLYFLTPEEIRDFALASAAPDPSDEA